MVRGIKNISGFTLVEVVLGLAISSMLMLAAMGVFMHMQRVYTKSQVISEVEAQGIQAMQVITQTIREAQSVSAPTPGNTADHIDLRMENGSLDTTSIVVEDDTLLIQESDGIPVELTNGRIQVTGLEFSNLSSNANYTTIQVILTLSHVNGSGRNEFSYTRTFESAAGFFTQ